MHDCVSLIVMLRELFIFMASSPKDSLYSRRICTNRLTLCNISTFEAEQQLLECKEAAKLYSSVRLIVTPTPPPPP